MRILLTMLLMTAPLGAVEYAPIDFSNVTAEFAASEWGIGYISRPCGFDINDNGIIGEPADCNVVCNDREGTTQILEDFDNDGAFEVQTYIDAQAGDDNLLCGGPVTPCQTVMYAKEHRFLETEGENVFCFKGVGHEELLVGGLRNGQPGFHIIPASGGMEVDHQIPSNPTMLVGWDYDQDGQYAPYDEDDIADFDGEITPTGEATSYINTFWRQDCREVDEDCVQAKNFLSTSRWEVAHLRVREYGTLPDPNPSRGIFKAERHDTWSGTPVEMGSHVYGHDILIDRMNYEGQTKSGSMIFEGWDRSYEEWIVWDNMEIKDFCGYIWRGGGGNGPKENFVLKNTTANWYCATERTGGPTTASTPGIKLWGTYDGVYVANNFWDQSPAAWAELGITKVAGGIMSINTCIRDFYAQGNIWKNAQDYFVVQGGLLRGCQARNGNNLNFKDNLIINDDDFNNFLAINISTGRDEMVFTENVTVENNVFLDLGEVPNLKRAVHVGDDVPGDSDLDPSDSWVRILNNTFYSPETDGYAGWFTVAAGSRRKLPDGTFVYIPDKSHNYEVRGNVFANETADRNFPNYSSQNHPALGEPLPIKLTQENNVWELVPHEDQSPSRKLWKSDNGDNDIDTNSLAEYVAHTGWGGTDRGHEQDYCKVEFVDRENGDVRLAETDTCANGAGANLDWLERPEPPASFCGDGVCDANESWHSCPADCEAPPPTPSDPFTIFTARSDGVRIVSICTITDAGTIAICREVEEVTVELIEPDN